jgi:TonB family protein
MPSFTLAQPQSSFAAAIPSTVVHGLLVAAAVWLSQAAPIDLTPRTSPIDLTFATASTPRHSVSTPVVSLPGAPVVRVPDLPGLPPIAPVPWHPGARMVDPTSLPTDPTVSTSVFPGTDTVLTAQVFREAEVDELPTLLSPGRLRYPPVLAEAGIAGSVTLTFVIDAEGRVDPAAIEILSATHPGFVEAAKEAVSTSRFHPARKHGAAVRVRVRQTVAFRK